MSSNFTVLLLKVHDLYFLGSKGKKISLFLPWRSSILANYTEALNSHGASLTYPFLSEVSAPPLGGDASTRERVLDIQIRVCRGNAARAVGAAVKNVEKFYPYGCKIFEKLPLLYLQKAIFDKIWVFCSESRKNCQWMNEWCLTTHRHQ